MREDGRMRVWRVMAGLAVGASMACAGQGKSTATPELRPVTGSGTAQQPAPAAPGAPGVAAAPAAPRPRREPPHPMRLDTLRKAEVAAVLASIKGRENEPAGKVFKNVQLFKDMPAQEFVTMMDEQYGRGLSLLCTGCHTDDKKYESDTRKDKVIARQMERMQRDIDAKFLAKVGELDKPVPKMTCVTCHRGATHLTTTMDVPTAPVPLRKR
jgi:hypothetical protein